jgi:hypothetical protein
MPLYPRTARVSGNSARPPHRLIKQPRPARRSLQAEPGRNHDQRCRPVRLRRQSVRVAEERSRALGADRRAHRSLGRRLPSTSDTASWARGLERRGWRRNRRSGANRPRRSTRHRGRGRPRLRIRARPRARSQWRLAESVNATIKRGTPRSPPPAGVNRSEISEGLIQEAALSGRLVPDQLGPSRPSMTQASPSAAGPLARGG